MTPDQLAKSGSEHGEQVALFAFCAVARIHGFKVAWQWADTGVFPKHPEEIDACETIPALEWLHAIPNGGSRGDDAKSRAIRGGQMKAEGVRQGVADVFLPWPIRIEQEYDDVGEPAQYTEVVWCGLYVEMKKPALKPKKEGTKGGLSDEQVSFAEYAKRVGYGWIVCYTWREAAKAIQQYIEWKG